jgi:hypothetical protein
VAVAVAEYGELRFLWAVEGVMREGRTQLQGWFRSYMSGNDRMLVKEKLSCLVTASYEHEL